MAIVWVAAVLAIALLVADPANRYEAVRLDAAQSVYQDGVPHTDRQGRAMARFEPERSFFPIGIYHGLSGEIRGRRYAMDVLRKASFNTVHTWEGQPFGPMLSAAERNGLQLIHHNPRDADIASGRASPNLLAWYLDEDPTIREWDPDWAERLERFHRRRDAIRAVDPERAVFALDGPFIDPPRRERWLSWNSAGDVSAHWNYPLKGHATTALTGRRGIPQSVNAAVTLNREKKPVWLVVQAFQSPYQDWRMPEARELRAMVYAGIVHGATGIVYFALDSFVTRDGRVLGVAPWTEESYGPSPDYDGDGRYPLVVSEEEADRSRRLWREIAKLNRELTDLVPVILTPTARLKYQVETNREGTPVRTLLKRQGNRFTLFAVNLDNRPVSVQFRFPRSLRNLRLVGESRNPPLVEGLGWYSEMSGFDVHIYRFELG